RREDLHAVVAPVPSSGALRDGHDLEHRDAEIAKVLEPFARCVERSGRRECADVQLVDHLASELRACPIRVAPSEALAIDDHRRPMYSFGLEARAGIRPRSLVVDEILV